MRECLLAYVARPGLFVFLGRDIWSGIMALFIWLHWVTGGRHLGLSRGVCDV